MASVRDHGIIFGTDGWRGRIADEFTVARLRIVAQAFSDWLKGSRRPGRVLVGYDGRYGGARFAAEAAAVIAGNGFGVDLTAGPTPTPALSWQVPRRRYAAGMMVTASHNPPAWSGVKVKPYFGGSPDETVIGPIVRHLGRRPPAAGRADRVGRVAFNDDYVAMLRTMVDLNAVARLKGTVVSDPMGGAQAGHLVKVLRGRGPKIVAIHDALDPMFCGLQAPEPVESNLEALKTEVRKRRAILGIATDGDGDRIGLVADGGRYVTPHLIFVLMMRFLLRERRMTGEVVKTVSGSFLIDRIARQYGLRVHETPVGFKHICNLMRTRDILIGGEESGGVGIKGYIPERDGLLIGLLALEMLAKTGKTCTALMAEITKDFGPSAFARLDTHHATAQASLRRLMASPPDRVGGRPVARVNTRDGLKLIFGDDSWLLFRASGTEPLLRIYAESESGKTTQALLAAGARVAGVRR